MHVTISAGRYTADSMLTALHEGGATRLCGGYCIHQQPIFVNYIANHRPAAAPYQGWGESGEEGEEGRRGRRRGRG